MLLVTYARENFLWIRHFFSFQEGIAYDKETEVRLYSGAEGAGKKSEISEWLSAGFSHGGGGLRANLNAS